MGSKTPRTLDIFGTRTYTVTMTLRDSGDTVNSTDGVFICTDDSGAVVTGSNTNAIQYVGTSPQVNNAISNTVYRPHADNTTDVSIRWNQTDDDPTPGSNPVSELIGLSVSGTHNEFLLNTAQTYTGTTPTAWNLGTITDQRPTNIDPNINYDITLTIPTESGFIADWSTFDIPTDLSTVTPGFGYTYTRKVSYDGSFAIFGSGALDSFVIGYLVNGVWGDWEEITLPTLASGSYTNIQETNVSDKMVNGLSRVIITASFNDGVDKRDVIGYEVNSDTQTVSLMTMPTISIPKESINWSTISGDGLTIGVTSDTQGRIYQDSGTWNENTVITFTDTVSAWKIALNYDGRVVVAEDKSYYTTDGSVWNAISLAGKAQLSFPSGPNLSDDGLHLIMAEYISGPNENQVRYYSRSNSTDATWTFQQTIQTPVLTDLFSIIMSKKEGNVLAVNENSSANDISVYRRTGNVWSLYDTISRGVSSGALLGDMSSTGKVFLATISGVIKTYDLSIETEYKKVDTLANLNSSLGSVQFTAKDGFSDNFNITYSQTQTTDSVDQGSTTITVTNV